MEVQTLLNYGGITIKTSYYACLETRVFLTGDIIEFYLKYLHQHVLTDEQRAKTY